MIREKKGYVGRVSLVIILIVSSMFLLFYIAPESGKSKLDNGELPIIVIDTMGKEILRDKEIKAKIKVYEDKHIKNFKNSKATIEEDITINIRGNSSAHVPKKQYSINFKADEDIILGETLLGMPTDVNWVLNSPYMDKSLIRNYLAYNTANEIMGYAPRTEFCEVFLNTSGVEGIRDEDYVGVYLAVEKIKQSDERVRLSEPVDYLQETSYIILRDAPKEDDVILDTYSKRLMTENGRYTNRVICKYPNKKELTEDKLKYITKDVDEIEKRIYSKNFKDPVLGYREYIDVDSFAEFIVINEFFRNIDGPARSAYYHKEIDGKLKAGPVWDFDLSMGNADFSEALTPYGFEASIMPWFDQLVKDEYFVDKVVEKYRTLRKTYLSEEYLFKVIDDSVIRLGSAINRNFQRWPEVYEENVFPNPTPATMTHDEEINRIKWFIRERGMWMDDHIEEIKN